MPIKAKVVARDIGGILKRETGTGALDLRLRLSFDLRPDWRLKSKARIDYSWSQEPGFDFLGRRIKLTKDADKALAELQRRVEADMERALARVKLRAAAERGWRSAHAVLELNRENPAVWVRIAPQRFHYGGYRIAGKTMYMTLGIQGTLESHIGAKPPATEAGPLPPIEPLEIKPGFALLKVPVVADYAVLEPVLSKALSKRAARPFELGKFGQVKARFDDIKIYGTDNGRLAVGITFRAESDFWWWRKANGRLWLTALPVNEPNSRVVGFRDLKIVGETDMVGEGLIFAIANSDDFQTVILSALQQNFQRDFDKLKHKIDQAIAFRKDGPVAYSVTLERIETGQIKAFGQGLYLPVSLHARMQAELVKMN
jgi:hypothetical protein